jgi:hypothetical protein
MSTSISDGLDEASFRYESDQYGVIELSGVFLWGAILAVVLLSI